VLAWYLEDSAAWSWQSWRAGAKAGADRDGGKDRPVTSDVYRKNGGIGCRPAIRSSAIDGGVYERINSKAEVLSHGTLEAGDLDFRAGSTRSFSASSREASKISYVPSRRPHIYVVVQVPASVKVKCRSSITTARCGYETMWTNAIGWWYATRNLEAQKNHQARYNTGPTDFFSMTRMQFMGILANPPAATHGC